MAQLVSTWLLEQEVPGSILGDFNMCFDFTLIRVHVAIALNIRKQSTDRGREGGKGHTLGFH